MTKAFVVIESCDDYVQILGLVQGSDLPDGGILSWPGDGVAMTAFPTRQLARAVINRTHHYAMAFGDSQLPEKNLCKVEPINIIEPDRG